MTGFRICRVPRSDALHVWHPSQSRRPVAFLIPRDDGLTLLTCVPDHPPAPLTDKTVKFATMDAVAAFLGIEAEAVAA